MLSLSNLSFEINTGKPQSFEVDLALCHVVAVRRDGAVADLRPASLSRAVTPKGGAQQ